MSPTEVLQDDLTGSATVPCHTTFVCNTYHVDTVVHTTYIVTLNLFSSSLYKITLPASFLTV